MLFAFDHSLSCPCLCISTAPGISTSWFQYLTSVKKHTGSFYNGHVDGNLHKEYKTAEERYENISQWFMDIVNIYETNVPVFIEDYSMGSKGRVFAIAENSGLMKYKLWRRGHDITSVPPTVIKKFAGKGNYSKEEMYEAFKKSSNFDFGVLNTGKNIGSPVSDIVDSYWLAQYAWSKI